MKLPTLGSGNNGANHCNCPLNMTEQEYAIVNDWTRDIGRHSVKFGAEIRHLQELRIPSDVNRTGQLQFADRAHSDRVWFNPGRPGYSLAAVWRCLDDVALFQHVHDRNRASVAPILLCSGQLESLS